MSKMSSLDKNFSNFLRAFAAARVLLQNAYKQGTLIEGVVLYAALVDGMCRICLVLEYQIQNKTTEIPEKYIYQHNEEKNYSERDIYNKALNNGILDQETYDELNALYDVRNKIVHRFFISEVEYSHMELACNRYEKLFEKLNQITFALESIQIEEGVGITVKGKKMGKAEEIEIYKDLYKKIKSKDEKNLAKTFNSTSVTEVVDFAMQHGLIQHCLCGHYRMKHINTSKPKDPTVLIEDLALHCLEDKCACTKFEQDLTKSEYLAE